VAQRLAIHLYQPQFFFVENCKGVAKFLARTMRRKMAHSGPTFPILSAGFAKNAIAARDGCPVSQAFKALPYLLESESRSW
jgi:hypothetical protein